MLLRFPQRGSIGQPAVALEHLPDDVEKNRELHDLGVSEIAG
jgi:hypothetical protein